MARVLPVPAPAMTATGPPTVVATSRCSGSRPASNSSGPDITAATDTHVTLNRASDISARTGQPISQPGLKDRRLPPHRHPLPNRHESVSAITSLGGGVAVSHIEDKPARASRHRRLPDLIDQARGISSPPRIGPHVHGDDHQVPVILR